MPNEPFDAVKAAARPGPVTSDAPDDKEPLELWRFTLIGGYTQDMWIGDDEDDDSAIVGYSDKDGHSEMVINFDHVLWAKAIK